MRSIELQPTSAFAGGAVMITAFTLLGMNAQQVMTPPPNQGEREPASQFCLPSIRDKSLPGSCIEASSNPAIGDLYPLGLEFNIDSTGRIGIGTLTPSEQVSVAGIVHSQAGGFRFPDGTIQSTAASTPSLPIDEIIVDTGAGTGSNTHIRRFGSVRKSVGSAISYSDSNLDGASFTINSDGIYSVHYSDLDSLSSSEGMGIGISVSSNALITPIQSLSYAQGKRSSAWLPNATGGVTSWTGRLSVGDVIRPHTDGGLGTLTDNAMMSVVKISG